MSKLWNACHGEKQSRWLLLTILAVSVLLGLLMAQRLLAGTGGETLVTTDYFVSHTSNEPFYAQYKLDPQVVIHVREVVLAGRERTVREDGRVLLLLPGGGVPGTVEFDLQHEQCSMMRYFASAGWDTFTLDFEGFGLSTRPLLMEAPSAFPESSAPIHSAVTLRDVERTVEFISALRGVEQVHLLGHSQGASREAPLYTMRHPEKVTKLVLFAPGYKNLGRMEQARRSAEDLNTKQKVSYFRPTVEVFYQNGSKQENLVPGVFDAWRAALLVSDAKSGELGGMVRSPAGRTVDMLRANPQFDATKITVPTLVIRGSLDTFATRGDNQLLISEVGNEVKEYVEIPDAGHFLQFEKINLQFFKKVKDFLETKHDKKQ